jgi:hypothetical protein
MTIQRCISHSTATTLLHPSTLDKRISLFSLHNGGWFEILFTRLIDTIVFIKYRLTITANPRVCWTNFQASHRSFY